MMSTIETARGYDDSQYLKEMADGLVSRRFGSVDEAAKTVLSEDGGSNVDRLRRKFREQNWYQRGLDDYVEAEIARRDLVVKPRHMGIIDSAIRTWRNLPWRQAKVLNEASKLVSSSIFSGGNATGLLISIMLLLVCVNIGYVAFDSAQAILLAISFFSLIIWSDRASMTSEPVKAVLHLVTLAVTTAILVAAFYVLLPSKTYMMGSLFGTLAFAVGMTGIGVYLTNIVSLKARREGRRKTWEASALIWSISLLSQSGTVLLLHDTLIERSRSSFPISFF